MRTGLHYWRHDERGMSLVFVAVGLMGADGGHGAGARLEHGHALDAALFGEPLGHPEFLGDDGGHD